MLATQADQYKTFPDDENPFDDDDEDFIANISHDMEYWTPTKSYEKAEMVKEQSPNANIHMHFDRIFCIHSQSTWKHHSRQALSWTSKKCVKFTLTYDCATGLQGSGFHSKFSRKRKTS